MNTALAYGIDHLDEAMNYARSWGLSQGDAEDIVQETSLALLRSPTQGPILPRAYWWRAVRSKVMEHGRRLKRQRTVSLEGLMAGDPKFTGPIALDAASQSEQQAEFAAVAAQAAGLPPAMRKSFAVFLMDEKLTVKDRVNMHRIRKRFRARLGRDGA